MVINKAPENFILYNTSSKRSVFFKVTILSLSLIGIILLLLVVYLWKSNLSLFKDKPNLISQKPRASQETKNTSPTFSIATTSLSEIQLIQQEPSAYSYGKTDRVLLSNLILSADEKSGSKLVLKLAYLIDGKPNTIEVEARSSLNVQTDKPYGRLYEIAKEELPFRVGDRVELLIMYVGGKADTSNIKMREWIKEISKGDQTLQDDGLVWLGDFGDQVLTADQIRARLKQPSAKFGPDEVLVTGITLRQR
ncbi:MAG: hypothetical protein UV61_C0005G0064 [Candidatus Gottesmanbacteria bacterium GW2011_GWB1_43_11]|uniref:Uncharacterized protein n=1 Tax=Candidatus Gottesmanbacteria bacterium GW2011_GWB1_43_11 TaxID=1618446 RepID=A0A0G1FJK1_9BACT|nr:MAG: hypothetical protein UV04_C0008G0022 [Candidatus Gottesmanbacteria bacterium GW2011_GWA2_42_16]KKS55955.1 MAG: hypothetical protein UV17_C0005G0064 [Candidatus Gottesmanbacteria bacterium GW2011_GWA1_42_26]KKS87043.1 MAG: hypothetical protein UV61_C0005G0064 [Candidatus Gottesmanbacteria bacterium GW2011_GWB1_43_11]OGG07571.1 MAG: hypothetical protein A2699_04905 [Candidatus Gottesmanbacteria bacterium RIFCSPHIGHO2_01_FULL_43_15]HCM38177.1 hypothetical protein [Patescibacteria group bac